MERFFHAPGRGAYFEGWYFKLQTRGGEALALIPALHQDAALRRSASLQVITREGSWWLEYPEAEFGASAERLRIRAGANIFTEKGLRVSADARASGCAARWASGPSRAWCRTSWGPSALCRGWSAATASSA